MKRNVTNSIKNLMQIKTNKIPKKPVVIVGGGWSGLATACYLTAQNIPVTVIESAKQLGGRARKSSSRTQTMDNGQHLMLGAYSEMLALFELIHIKEEEAFARCQQQLKLLNGRTGDSLINMTLPNLPKPLNLLVGMLRAKGLTLKEKFQVLKNFDQLLKQPLANKPDLTVSDWINNADLPANYVSLLEALCLAALNTPASKASALSFQNVLNQTFQGTSGSTDLLIPALNLGQVFPAPAKTYLASNNARVLFPQKVSCLSLDDGNLVADVLSESHTHSASTVVLATPPHISRQLMDTIPACTNLCEQIGQLEYEPITTVYLKYTDECQIPELMIGLSNTIAEWVFDRRVCDQPGMMAVVISSSGKHMEKEPKDLSLAVIDELARLFPDWPTPNASWVIREKRATFSCTPAANKIRPGVKTPVGNLFLSGDYLLTDDLYLPATLETAIRNAKACAREVINYLNSAPN